MTHDETARPPQQFIVMRPLHRPDWTFTYRFVRNAWWSGSRLSLQQAIQRVDRTLLVYTVAEADRLFPNVGSFQKERPSHANGR